MRPRPSPCCGPRDTSRTSVLSALRLRVHERLGNGKWEMESQAERRNAGTGNVGVLGGFDAAPSYGTEALPVLEDRHAPFEHAVRGRCAQEREAPAVDAVLVHLALAAAQGGRAGLGGGDMRRQGGGAVEPLQPQQMAA